MAAILKNWREAATLILVTRKSTTDFRRASFPQSIAKTRGDNFDILMLKRSSESTFMPNAYVFPGGVADDADFSAEWLDVFHAVGKEMTSVLFEFVTKRPTYPMFSRIRDPTFSSIPSEIAMRICAIRETFEESGVLLVRPVSEMKKLPPTFGTQRAEWGSVCSDTDVIDKWRHRIDKDASKFLTMCKELSVVPDVWSLFDWSNWLTPVRLLSKRFDTAFFTCCIPERIAVAEDKGETVHAQWITPLQILHEYENSAAQLAPPQLYTLFVLSNFANVDDLRDVVFRGLPWHSKRWLPVKAVCDDGFLMLMPGDDLYPENVDVEGVGSKTLTLPGTIEDQREKTNNHNRAEIRVDLQKGAKYHLLCNLEYGDRRLLPLQLTDVSKPQATGSKL